MSGSKAQFFCPVEISLEWNMKARSSFSAGECHIWVQRETLHVFVAIVLTWWG